MFVMHAYNHNVVFPDLKIRSAGTLGIYIYIYTYTYIPARRRLEPMHRQIHDNARGLPRATVNMFSSNIIIILSITIVLLVLLIIVIINIIIMLLLLISFIINSSSHND